MTDKAYTDAQRRSLHLACELLANRLNDAGLDMKTVLEAKTVDVPWTKTTIKEVLYKPILEAMTLKSSTEDMDTAEPSKVWDVLNRHLGTLFGVTQEFPSHFGDGE